MVEGLVVDVEVVFGTTRKAPTAAGVRLSLPFSS